MGKSPESIAYAGKFDESLAAFSKQVTDHSEGKLYADGLFVAQLFQDIDG